ncbi:hypothetical protein [Sphingomonas sp. 2378]|uniref:hypothetical protein n=1 Tax=Sphingomonas sp. 2378 TaxID=1219748 RepID=UPI00311ACC6B
MVNGLSEVVARHDGPDVLQSGMAYLQFADTADGRDGATDFYRAVLGSSEVDHLIAKIIEIGSAHGTNRQCVVIGRLGKAIANPLRDYSVVSISHDFHLSPVCSGFRWLATLFSAQEWRKTAILVGETGFLQIFPDPLSR